MDTRKHIMVEVAYALPGQQLIIPVYVEPGCTIKIAIERSGMLERFPEIDLSQQKVGIFSQARALTDRVQAGDRIEIYRDLIIDPKDARRNRAVAAGQVLKIRSARRRNKNRPKSE